MDQAHSKSPTAHAESSDEVSVIDLMIVFAKHKKFIFGATFGVAVVAVAISLALPNSYKASAKLLPPQQAQSGAAALLSQLGGGVASVAGIKNPNDMYVGMLKSRTVADHLIERWNLKKVYLTDSQEKARAQLQGDTDIASGKDNLISIQVESLNPKLSAQLANGYIDELVKLSRVLALTEAAQRRQFFEQQLDATKNKLANAEMALKGAIDTHGVISVDVESRGLMETVARLKAEAATKEIQLNSLRAFVTTSNPEFKRVDQELISLRGQIAKLETGSGAAALAGGPAGAPGAVQNIALLRDVKYYQMLYELLAKQFEVARLDEAKESSAIQVLDAAVEPERKSKPRRAIIVLVSTLLAFLASVGWVFAAEAQRRALQSAASASRWAELKSHLWRR